MVAAIPAKAATAVIITAATAPSAVPRTPEAKAVRIVTTISILLPPNQVVFGNNAACNQKRNLLE